MTTNRQTSERSPRSGAFVVAILALVFFVLLALIFTSGRRRSPARPAEARYLYVLPTRLRIRAEPGPEGAVLASVARGEKLQLLEDRGAWVQVKAPDGVSGWSERSFLEGEPEHARRIARVEAIRRLPPLEGVVEKKTPLYGGPGIFYPVVGDLTPPTRVRVYTRDHDFYAVDAAGEIAYADVDAIDLSGSAGGARLEVSEAPEAGEPVAPPAAAPPVATATSLPPPPLPVPQPPVENVIYATVPPGGVPPVVERRTRPRYPVEARRAGVEGTVVIRAVIRKDGSVDDVQVLQDLPYGLGDAAREAVQDWRFRPARYRDRPIDVYYTVTVNFRVRP